MTASVFWVASAGWVVAACTFEYSGGPLVFLGHSRDTCPCALQWKHLPSFLNFSWCSMRGRLCVWVVSTSMGTEVSLCFPLRVAFHCCFLSFLSFGVLVRPRFFFIAYRLFSSRAAVCHWWMVSGHLEQFMQACDSPYGKPCLKRGISPLVSSFRLARFISRLNLAMYWSRFPSFI